jgi:hypothetical protein
MQALPFILQPIVINLRAALGRPKVVLRPSLAINGWQRRLRL